jgi:hypothetical protein
VAGHVLVRPGLPPYTVAGYLTAIAVAHRPDTVAARLATNVDTARSYGSVHGVVTVAGATPGCPQGCAAT